MSEDKVVDVSVGVLIREDGRVLLASRPEGKPWAGYWEFPGGKLEDGETVHQARVRELDEELGVRLADSFPWFVKEHRYEHAHVRLHFRRSRDFFGEALSKEGQDFGFYAANERTPGVLLPIDQNILNRVDLPDVWEDSTAVLTLSANVMKAVAMDFDFVIVKPEVFEATLWKGEPRLPTYVEDVPASDLRLWQDRGAHGVKP